MKKIFLTTIFGFGLVMNAMADPTEEDIDTFQNISGYERYDFKNGKIDYKDDAIAIIQKYVDEIKKEEDAKNLQTLVSDLQCLFNQYYKIGYNYAFQALKNKSILNFDGKDEIFKDSYIKFSIVDKELKLSFNEMSLYPIAKRSSIADLGAAYRQLMKKYHDRIVVESKLREWQKTVGFGLDKLNKAIEIMNRK